jgi:Kef-type K+ transport system membrane component KefB
MEIEVITSRSVVLTELIPGFLHFNSLQAANSILLLGLILFLGATGGFIFKKLKIPQVVGYIVIGILLGQSGFRLVSYQVISTLEPVSSFALSLIGFLIGAELKGSVIRKYGKQFIGILLLESIIPFLCVGALVSLVSFFVTRDLHTSVALGLLLGAISSATAPAATTDVLAENRTKGPLTTLLLGVVAMDDAVALVLFAVASVIAGSLVGERTGAFGTQFLSILYSIGVSCAFGAVAGFLLSRIIKRVKNDDGRTLAFSLGAIMLLTGICTYLKLDTILAAMAMGCFIVNFAPKKSVELFALVDRFTPPIYVMFFVLVGAKLNIWGVSAYFAVIAVVYVVARTLGKSFGSTLGARLTGAPKTVQKYMKWCLLSQAGVAIGLSISSAQLFPDTLGPTVMLVVTATTFIVQLIGPLCVKHGVTKAGECGLDITEEDLLRQGTVGDVLSGQKADTFLSDAEPFSRVLQCFSTQASLSCPVCDKDRKLVGIVTIDNLKDALQLGEIAEGLVSCDLMDSAPITCSVEDSLIEIKGYFVQKDLDSIPVISKTGSLVGIIEDRMIEQYFHKKVLELHKRVTTLEQS